MDKRIRVIRKWVYEHVRPVDSLSVADVSGDTIVCDLRNQLVYLDDKGRKVWDKSTDFAPLKAKVTESGDTIYILTVDGYLIKLSRDAELLWDVWLDRNPQTLAARAKGQVAAVGTLKARFYVVNNVGEKIRLVHTSEPVAYARFSGKTGGLFVASAQGWIGLYDKHFKPRGEFNLGQPIAKLEVTDRGTKIFLPAREEGLQVIEVESSQLVTYNPGFTVSSVGIDGKGERIVAAGLGGEIAVMDSAGNMAWSAKTDHSWVHCEMTRRGDRFTLLSGKGVVACYRVVTGKEAREEAMESSQFDFLEV